MNSPLCFEARRSIILSDSWNWLQVEAEKGTIWDEVVALPHFVGQSSSTLAQYLNETTSLVFTWGYISSITEPSTKFLEPEGLLAI